MKAQALFTRFHFGMSIVRPAFSYSLNKLSKLKKKTKKCQSK